MTWRPLLGPGHGRRLGRPPRPVLADAGLDARLRRDGFAITPVIGDEQLARLRELFFELHPEGEGFQADLTNPDTALRSEVSRVLAEELDELVLPLFLDHVAFLRNFLCKWPGEDSELYLHRDWSYIDESHGDHTFVVWIPLVDVGWQEGALQVLRHSHRVDQRSRGSRLSAAWVDDEAFVRPRLVTVPVPAGSAAILDNALVHCSLPNRSGVPRPVAAIGVRPRTAPLVHYRLMDDASVARFDVDESFFLTYTPADLEHAPPDLPVEAVQAEEAAVGEDAVERSLASSLLTRADAMHRSRAQAPARDA